MLGYRVDLEELESILRERLLVDANAVATFAAGLRTFLDDPQKVSCKAAVLIMLWWHSSNVGVHAEYILMRGHRYKFSNQTSYDICLRTYQA